MDMATASKIISILSQRGEELGKLAASAGSGAITKFLDEHPEAKEKLGGGYEELQKLAERSGAPEAKKMVEETTQQVIAIFKDGESGLTISYFAVGSTSLNTVRSQDSRPKTSARLATC